MLNRLLIICCLLGIVGCKAKKQVIVSRSATPIIKPANDVNDKLIAIRARQVNFNTFSGKAHAKLDINGDDNDCNLNIRINRGHKIWVSITSYFGIEVARALITPDSIQVINRLQGLYLKKPFGYIYGYASKQVNYKTLESLLIGNAIPELLNDSAKFNTVNNNTTLSGNLQDLVYKLLIGPDLKVTETNLSDQNAGQSLQVSNNVFILADNHTIPSQIDIASTTRDKKVQVNIKYSRVDFNQQLEYPFNIPERYTPAD